MDCSVYKMSENPPKFPSPFSKYSHNRFCLTASQKFPNVHPPKWLIGFQACCQGFWIPPAVGLSGEREKALLTHPMMPKIWCLPCHLMLNLLLRHLLSDKQKNNTQFSRNNCFLTSDRHVCNIRSHSIYLQLLNALFYNLFFWEVPLLSTVCYNNPSFCFCFSLSFSHILRTLASISDASLELCVMPKDEDILQLVSSHSSRYCNFKGWCSQSIKSL